MSILKKIKFKVIFEYFYPKIFFTQIFKFFLFKKTVNFKNKDSLCFIYNLSILPITFDFLEIICQSELIRREKNLKYIDIIFLYHSKNKFVLKPNYGEYSNTINQLDYRDRFYEIIIQSTKLFKNIKNIYLIDEKSYKNFINYYQIIYPDNFKLYKYTYPKYKLPTSNHLFYPMIESGNNELNFIKKYIKNHNIKKKIITISIRDNTYLKIRNSNLSAWVKFAKKYKKHYEFIFITDNSNIKYYPIIANNNFLTFDFISWSIPIRAALYKLSFLNMSVGSGPIHLSLFQGGCRTLMFLKNHQKLSDSGYLTSINNYYKIEIGENRGFLNKNNKYIWKNDTFVNIEYEFKLFIKNINNK